MLRKCCVEYCENSEWKNYCNGEITFHVFPSAEKLKSIWITQIKIGNNQIHVNYRGVVCSVHFNTQDFIKTTKKTILRSSAIPVNFPNSRKENGDCHENFIVIKQEFVQMDDDSVKPDFENVIIKEEVEDDVIIKEENDQGFEQGNNQGFEQGINHEINQGINQGINHVIINQENSVFTSNGVAAGIEFIDVLSPPTNNTKTIRYPGDIDVSVDMCPETARQNILLCQAKIKAQAKEIYRLKQISLRQRLKINKMERLLKENSIKPPRRSYASTSSNDSNFEHFNTKRDNSPTRND